MQGHRPTGGGAEGGRGGEGVVVVPPPRPGGRQGGVHPAQPARALPSCHARIQPTYGGIIHLQLLDFLVVISLSFLGQQYLIKALVSSRDEDPDSIGFNFDQPDPVLLYPDPDPTCNNGFIRLFSS